MFPNRISGIDPKALEILQRYRWPGNVRQLENFIESLFAMGTEGRIGVEDLPDSIREDVALSEETSAEPQYDDAASLHDAERHAVERALRAADGNKSRAAAMLQISRTRLYRKIREYNLTEYLD
jgi:transcriptional regulator with PAS, ATPase and Fis domain